MQVTMERSERFENLYSTYASSDYSKNLRCINVVLRALVDLLNAVHDTQRPEMSPFYMTVQKRGEKTEITKSNMKQINQ